MTFDPLADERMSPDVSIPRGADGRPLIVPRGGAVPEEYDRASGFSDHLAKDVFGIKRWELRYLAQAMAKHEDIRAKVAAIHYSTGPLTGTQPISTRQANGRLLDDYIAEALEREKINEAANAGTAVHSFVEPGAPDPLGQHPLIVDAVREHHKLTAAFDRVGSEIFVVCDELRVAGTFDAAFLTPEYPGCVVIGDTKTGKNYHQAEFEIQMAIYAHGELYYGPPRGDEDQRMTFIEAFGMPVNLSVGYIVHVPLEGKPKPRVVKVDLERGWRNACLAAQIRDARQALDKVGIGEKFDHRDWGITRMREEFEALMRSSDEGHPTYVSAEVFRERGLALYARFSHIWPTEYTEQIKRRLS